MEQPEKNRIREDFEMWITFIPDEVIDLKKCFLRKDELIKFYKKESIVPIWIENFNSEPEEDLLEPFSYSPSFIKQVKEVYRSKYNSVIILCDFEYDDSVGSTDKMIFVGCYGYKNDVIHLAFNLKLLYKNVTYKVHPNTCTASEWAINYTCSKFGVHWY